MRSTRAPRASVGASGAGDRETGANPMHCDGRPSACQRLPLLVLGVLLRRGAQDQALSSMPPRAPGATSTDRFFDANGDRREEPLIPVSPESDQRIYTGQVIYPHVDFPDTPLGCVPNLRLKVFKCWRKDSRKVNGGVWGNATELHPDDAHLAPWAALHTMRNVGGEPCHAKAAVHEALCANAVMVGQFMSAGAYVCNDCGAKPGDPWPWKNGSVLSTSCFCLDHTEDENPSWLPERTQASIGMQLQTGKAQILCFFCNDEKTNGRRGQGDTVPHINREIMRSNFEKHQHLLPGSSTDASLQNGIKRSQGQRKSRASRKRKAN